jgi:hypothetical protein
LKEVSLVQVVPGLEDDRWEQDEEEHIRLERLLFLRKGERKRHFTKRDRQTTTNETDVTLNIVVENDVREWNEKLPAN